MKLQENIITIRGNRTKTTGKRTKTERMLGTNHGKSLGKWRKPERMLGANHHDAINMLEKYSESAGKCDNNERKWCKKDRKMKETGKTLGLINILKRYEKCRKPEEMVQKPMEERGEHDRKYVVKKSWTKHIENPQRGRIGKSNEN